MSETRSLTRLSSPDPIRKLACGKERNAQLAEQAWLERVNTREAQYKLTQKAKAYAKFKPLKGAPKAPEVIERVPEIVRPITAKTCFVRQGKGVGSAMPLGARPKGWVSSFTRGSGVGK